MPKSYSKPIRPVDAKPLPAIVLRRERVSASIARVTVGGPGLDALTPAGFDQWFRLFIPPTGVAEVALPSRGGYVGYAKLLTTPKAIRPTMRNYTVRELRRGAPGSEAVSGSTEIDIDFVLHGDHGVASQWAQRAEIGQEVGILDEGTGWNPETRADRVLLATDETGLPAVAGICASLPDDARGWAFVEVPLATDAQDFRVPSGVELVWLPRATGVDHGTLALDAVRQLDLAGDPSVHAFSAGVASLATGVRRLLVTERAVPKTHVDFCGYWRPTVAH